jgi:hypothetical protein
MPRSRRSATSRGADQYAEGELLVGRVYDGVDVQRGDVHLLGIHQHRAAVSRSECTD